MGKSTVVKLEELGKTVMPIVGFWGPPDEVIWKDKTYPSLKTDEVFALIKEAGVNVFLQDNDPYSKKRESVEKTLELCAKHNLFYYVSAGGICEFSAYHNQSGESKVAKVNEIKEAIEPFIRHPNCAGLSVVDEPLPSALPSLGGFLENYKAALAALNVSDKGYYVNLLPVTSLLGEPTVACWQNYIRQAVTHGKLDYVSYDFYAFQTPGISKDDLSAGFYTHMEAVKEVADELNDVSYGVCVPTGGYWTEEADNVGTRRATPEELEWAVNAHLAFGCKMITYFTLCNPISFIKYLPRGATGILTPEGKKSDLFTAVKKANTQIAAVDEYLLNAQNKQVLVVGNVPSRLEYVYGNHVNVTDSSYRELVYVEGDGVLVGCFEYEKKSAFYVVNTFKKKQTVKLVFNGLKEMKTVTGLDGERTVKDSELSLPLEKGGATLIIIQKWL